MSAPDRARVTAAFKEAEPFPKQADIGGRRGGWNETIVINDAVRASAGAHAVVRAGDHLDIATVRYSDERAPRQLFPPADYTNISDVRRLGTTLFILRSIALFRTEYRLTAFDVDQRAPIADRRVDLADVR